MLEHLPEKYQKLSYFLLLGFIFAQLIPMGTAVIEGHKIVLAGCWWLDRACHTIIPISAAEVGGWLGRTSVMMFGFWVWYWWGVRKKLPKK